MQPAVSTVEDMPEHLAENEVSQVEFLRSIVAGHRVPVIRSPSGLGYCIFVVVDETPRRLHGQGPAAPRASKHRITCPHCRVWAKRELSRLLEAAPIAPLPSV